MMTRVDNTNTKSGTIYVLYSVRQNVTLCEAKIYRKFAIM